MALGSGFAALTSRNGGSHPPDRLLSEPVIFKLADLKRQKAARTLPTQEPEKGKAIGRKKTKKSKKKSN